MMHEEELFRILTTNAEGKTVLAERSWKSLMVANYRAGIGGISHMRDNQMSGLKEEGSSAHLHSTTDSWAARLPEFAAMIPLSRKCDITHAHSSSGWEFIPAFSAALANVVTYHGSVNRSRSFVPESFVERFVATIIMETGRQKVRTRLDSFAWDRIAHHWMEIYRGTGAAAQKNPQTQK